MNALINWSSRWESWLSYVILTIADREKNLSTQDSRSYSIYLGIRSHLLRLQVVSDLWCIQPELSETSRIKRYKERVSSTPLSIFHLCKYGIDKPHNTDIRDSWFYPRLPASKAGCSCPDQFSIKAHKKLHHNHVHVHAFFHAISSLSNNPYLLWPG